jgi:chromosome segregation ATPase
LGRITRQRKDGQMSDIHQLEGRITAALDRIREATARQQQAAPASEVVTVDTADLSAQLDDERTANAQLEERVKALKDRQDSTIADLEVKAAGHAQQLAELEAEIQRLRGSNADLRDVTAQLRSAAADGATAPELINRATIAEVEALQAQRASEVVEIDAVLSTLKPLIVEA